MAIAAVRPATPDDVDEIVRIQALTWRAAYAGLVPDEAIAQRTAGSWRGPDRRTTALLISPTIIVFLCWARPGTARRGWQAEKR